MTTGGRGAGKTALLDEIAEAYGNRAPRVLLDLASPQYSQEQPDGGADDMPLLALLRDLKFDLEPWVQQNGRLHFPRLSLALLAVTTWQPDARLTRDEAQQRLAAAREDIARIAHHDRDWVNDWIADVVSNLGGGAAPFPVSVFVTATVHAFLAKTLSARHRAAPLKWHMRYAPSEPGDGYEALITLGRNFHIGGDFRARAERALVASFLADVRAGYQRLASMNRVAYPLVLLDNVDASPVGERFLELVRDIRTRDAATPAPTDHLVIVAADAAYPGARPSGTRAMPLVRLGRDDVLTMLADADPMRLAPDLPHLIHRLTGGLPLGVAVITEGVTHAVPAAEERSARTYARVAGPSILGLAVPGAGDRPAEPVATRILRQLIQDGSQLSRLITLAAALDAAEAEAAASKQLDADRGTDIVSQATRLLDANGWHGTTTPFIGDPFLRSLLLHELGRRQDPPTSVDVHRTLRDHHALELTGQIVSAEAFRLHHCLALGETGHVVRRLRDSFADSVAEEWLEALWLISRAPHYGTADARRDVALGEAEQPAESAVYRSVNRLLHALWFLADPLNGPDPKVVETLGEELRFLAREHREGNKALSDAARAWPTQFKRWRQSFARPTEGE
jgi:hypothetical protein